MKGMKLLPLWIIFSAAVLIASAAAHGSTYLGIDPMEAIPGVMMIHLMIFPPFIAAMYYARKASGSKSDNDENDEKVMRCAPRWLQIMTKVFMAYAVLNFIIFIFLVGGGGPREKDGKYVLANHGQVIRELTEEEFHRYQAYVVRGFSGHWMLFSSASLLVLVGAGKMHKKRKLDELSQISAINAYRGGIVMVMEEIRDENAEE
jgi:hypothetical protein